jgi:U3 small nucleolar RNA-associated protein 10
MRYKHTAVTCVDKIAEKYGKKDIEAVVAAATTIAGEHCLGQPEQRLRVMALLCLTSLVDVLQDAIVPVLPSAIPQAVKYLDESLKEDARDEELHVASYGFISALAQHLPYMLSTYLDRILEVSNKSAEIDLEDNTRESRVDCLHFLAKQLEAKEIFSALDRNWESARSAGFSVSSIIMLQIKNITNYRRLLLSFSMYWAWLLTSTPSLVFLRMPRYCRASSQRSSTFDDRSVPRASLASKIF